MKARTMGLKVSLLLASAALPALAAAPHKVRLVELWGQLPPLVVNDGDAAIQANVKAQQRYDDAKARYEADLAVTDTRLTAQSKAAAESLSTTAETQLDKVNRKYGIDAKRMQEDEAYAEQVQARMQADMGFAMEYSTAMMEAAQPVTQAARAMTVLPPSIQALMPGEAASRERLACRNFISSWNDPSRKSNPSADEAALVAQATAGFARCPEARYGLADGYGVRECRVRNQLQYLNGQLALLQKDEAGRVARADAFKTGRGDCGVAVKQQQQLIEAAYADPALQKGAIPQISYVPGFEKDALKQLDFFAANALATSPDGQVQLKQQEVAEMQAIQRQHVVHGPIVEGKDDPALLNGRIGSMLLAGRTTVGSDSASSVSDKVNQSVDAAKDKAKNLVKGLFGK